jgi:hypothetical protein
MDRSSRGGSMVDVHLTDYSVAALMKMTIADLKEGVFVGATAEPLPNGMLRVLEIHLIPRGQNGNSFSRPFDLGPDSSMIQCHRFYDGRWRRWPNRYAYLQGGEKKVVIPANLTRTRQRFACRLIGAGYRCERSTD